MRTECLGNIAETVMGQAPPGGDCNKEGRGTVFVKAGEFDGRFPVVREWTTSPLKFAKNGDVLVCVVGATAGKVNQAIDCAIGRSVAAVRPHAKSLDTGYLYHFLSNRTGLLRAKSQGLAQGVITRDMLHEIKVPLPSLEEQRRIASILDTADALRAKRRVALAKLGSLAQSIFIEMFGDPGTNPKQLPVVKVGDLLSSANYGTSEKAGSVGAFPILRMNNITYDGRINLSDLKYIDLDKRMRDRFLVTDGDILFNRTNSQELVGKSAVYRGEDNIAFAGYLVRLRPNSEAVPDYICSFLNSKYGKATLRGMCKSIIGMANINATEVQSINIPKPPVKLQAAFAHQLAEIYQTRAQHEHSLGLLETLFASLQHRAFLGQL
jgi:type I restriction enzyme S subunit